MPPLVEAVPDEIVGREGEDVSGKAVHATPPVTAALPLGLANQAQIRGRRHAERLRGSADGKLLAGDDPKLPLIDLETWATKPLPLGASATEAAFDPFHNQRPLQLRDGRDDREDGGAQRRPSINGFAQADELHTQVAEEFEGLDQMTNGSSEAVERGDDHHINAAGLHVTHEAVEVRPTFAHARARGVVFDHVVPPASLAVGTEIVSLVLDRLLRSAHAQGASDPRHRPPPSRPSSARERKAPASPSTMWSRTRMPTSSPTSQRRLVIARSSLDGEGSPLGWLWTRTRAAAEPAMAGLKTSRGCTRAAVSEPRLTRLIPLARFFPSSKTTKNASRSKPATTSAISFATSPL